MEKILSKTSENCIPIILLDWNIVRNKREKSYQGHFVPIVGYGPRNIYVHNHGLKNPRAFRSIPKKTFEKARKSQGTDEDILFVYRKTEN